MIKKYFSSKKLSLILFSLIIILSVLYFAIFNVPVYAIFIYFLILVVITLLYFIADYNYKYRYYKKILDLIQGLDKKYMFLQLENEKPNFYEAQLMLNILDEVATSAIKEISMLKAKKDEYEEYIDLWVHEIKMPIATLNLMIENSDIGLDLKDGLVKQVIELENLVTQVLYFSKVDKLEKDYVISKIVLKDIVTKVIKRNAKEMIIKNMTPKLHDLEICVTSDTMWLEYILNQIIQNSIKYNFNTQGGVIEICCAHENKKVILYIKDNSCGIEKADLGRIFDKGFTGENGRKLHQKSTGMGLYLSKRLSEKLGHRMYVNSEINKGTTICIEFEKGVRDYNE